MRLCNFPSQHCTGESRKNACAFLAANLRLVLFAALLESDVVDTIDMVDVLDVVGMFGMFGRL